MFRKSQYFKRWLRQGTALSLLAFLAACGSVGSPPDSSGMGNGYLLTVKIGSSDNQTTVAQKYGGEAISWQPESGFAILKMSEAAAAQLKNRGISMQGTTLEPNAPVATPAVAQGWNAWGGGWNAWAGGWNAWAGGWNAWAGGWNVWAGGTTSIPMIPSENRFAFLQTKLPQAQAVSKNFGSSIKVAVIDTGIDTTHPMFSGRLAPSTEWKDFVDGDANPQDVSGGSAYGHGTAVTGIILQAAPRATILPIRVLASDGTGDVANVVSGIDWALQKGAKVINLSLGTDTDVAALKSEISYANSLGVYVVTSAGNTGANMTYPAANAQSAPYSDKLMSVGSVDSKGARSSFSSYGTALKYMAPGESIYSAYPGSKVALVKGTSFAAPMVTGTLALAMGETASTNWSSLPFWLANSTFGSGSTGSVFGIINVVNLLQKLPGFQRKQALLVVSNTLFLNNSENAIKSRLESLGYTVTLVSDLLSAASSATGKDVVLITDSVGALLVGNKFRSVSAPVVVWDADLFDDMSMTNLLDFGISLLQTQLTISNSTHPLASGLTGNQTIFSALNTITYGRPTASAIKAATVTNNPNNAVVFGYDKGSSMVGGYAAPGRRVGLFLSSNADQVNSMGGQILESAVTWAVSGN